MFDHMLEGYAYCRMLFDDEGKPDDLIYLDVNPAFSRLTGLGDVVNRRITEVIPGIKEENPEARVAGRALIEEGKAAGPKRRTFVYANNRLEGNAISTIAAMMEPTT